MKQQFHRHQFRPSPYSHQGYGAAETAALTETGTAESAPPAEEGLEAYAAYIPFASQFTKGILGIGEIREPEIVEADLARLRKDLRSAKEMPKIPFTVVYPPGSKGAIRAKISKLEAELKIAMDRRAKSEAVARMVKITVAASAVTGLVLLGAIAVTQIQKARRQQLEIKLLKEKA